MSFPPLTHQEDSQLLTGDGLVDLFEITLLGAPTSTTVFFKDGPPVSWQGNTYEGLACKIGGIKTSVTGEMTRPVLTVMNPAGLFNGFAFQGYFEGSTVIHSQVLYQNILNDVNIANVHYWRLSRVYGLISGQSVSFELRAFADGPSFTIPARKYMPDAGFPFVNL